VRLKSRSTGGPQREQNALAVDQCPIEIEVSPKVRDAETHDPSSRAL
jgi:hypothetical protein